MDGTLVERLRALLAAGATFSEAARRLGVPRSTLYSIAARHNLPRRRRGLSPHAARIVRRELQRGHNSVDEIARVAGCHRSTVYRHAGPIRCDGRAPKAVREKWRCPSCRALIKIDRCLLCKIPKPEEP